jgi:hypothetical protein
MIQSEIRIVNAKLYYKRILQIFFKIKTLIKTIIIINFNNYGILNIIIIY